MIMPIYTFLLIEVSTLCLMVFANNDTKPFRIKDKIDWSRWTTVDGQSEQKTAIIISTVTSIEKKQKTFSFDWSQWDKSESASKGTTKNVNPEIEKLLLWLKKTSTTEATTYSIDQYLPTITSELPRKPKVTKDEVMKNNKNELSHTLKSVLNNSLKMSWNEAPQNIIEVVNLEGNLETVQERKESVTMKNEPNRISISRIKNRGATMSGLEWSRWNESILEPSTKEPNTRHPVESEDFKNMETNQQALSFFGWPWWAWLICVLITVVLLGLVYIAVFWNDFKDCLHGREIFCSVSRDDK